jgi:hypothetical protein
MASGASEPLGAQDGHDEVREEEEGDDPEDECFHGKGGRAGAQRTFSQNQA